MNQSNQAQQQKAMLESEHSRAEGLKHEKAGNYPQAIECFQKALTLCPGSYNAWINMGVVLIKAQQYKAAEEAFRKVLKFSPDDTVALNNLGYVLLHSNPQEAENIFKRYLELKPRDVQAQYNYSIALQQNDKSAQALDILEQLVAQTSPQPIILNNTGLLAFNVKNDADTAVTHITHALSLQPDLMMGWYNLAMIVAKRQFILNDEHKRLIGMNDLGDDANETATRLLEKARDLGLPIE
ncbi:tetratricopeptide repeat protein [Marinobacterium marinum]|uniref:Tetratricopeptide repeat protein n=1 Tax=Marinobacterium marinum TaxID=2756129 RepID=A0A7W2AA04_9GAMM|nr:tetratricopeptide repeat protein [Marinobacterium marinum]MBA4501326.1 tetratricopeptide repeat protein [Marinobacterium marinum]